MMHTKEFLYLKKIFFYFCRIFILPRFTKVVCISKQDFGLCKKLSNKVLLENCLGIESSAKDYQIQRQNIILIYGRNSVSKNTSRTINILKILNDIQDFKSNDLEIIVAGKEVKHLNLCSETFNVFESPNDSQVKELFRKASFFISLSKYEGFGIAPLEAMSFGIMPILSDIENHTIHLQKLRIGKSIDLELKDQEISDIVFKFISKFNKLDESNKLSLRKSLYEYTLEFSKEKWNSKVLEIFK